MSQPDAVIFVSGGLASWATAMLATHNGKYQRPAYIFNDVLIEDQDCYRFLIEGMSRVLDVPAPKNLLEQCMKLPNIDSDSNVDLRKEMLSEIRAETIKIFPNFHWLVDGRLPWQAWEDGKFVGNSLVAPCSRLLKAAHGDEWMKNHAPDAVAEYGFYFDELHRILKLERLKKFKIGRTLYESGLVHGQIAAWAKRIGLQTGRSYSYGYTHDNCSGLCCRAGHKHWAEKYRRDPCQARFVADKEAQVMEALGTQKTMLADRNGARKKPLPLHKFLDSLDQQPSLFDQLDNLGSGCGCYGDQ